MDLKKLHDRVRSKLPSIEALYRDIHRSKARFEILACHDKDIRWLYEHRDCWNLGNTLRAARLNKLCPVCKYNLAFNVVCKSCYRTKDGREESQRLRLLSYNETNIKRYGVPWSHQRPEVVASMWKTWNEKHGGHPYNNPVVHANVVKSHRDRTGYDYPFQNPETRRKSGDTRLERYGGREPGNCPSIFNRQQKSFRAYKEVRVAGTTLYVQGFEPHVLEMLDRKGLLSWVTNDAEEMPPIFYTDEVGKEHRYFPDFVFESKKTGLIYVVEVKSIFTLRHSFTILKAEAAMNAARKSKGLFKYIIILMTRNGEFTMIDSLRNLRKFQRN